MLGSLVGAILLVCMAIYKEPMYAVAAGLFELSGVIYHITRSRRLDTKGVQK